MTGARRNAGDIVSVSGELRYQIRYKSGWDEYMRSAEEARPKIEGCFCACQMAGIVTTWCGGVGPNVRDEQGRGTRLDPFRREALKIDVVQATRRV